MSEQLYQRASLLLEQKRYSEAEQALGELLGQQPNNPQLLAMYAQTLLELEQYERAKETIQRAIALSPDSSELYFIGARIQLAQKKYSLAEEQLEQAIQLDPAEAVYHALLGAIKLSRKQPEAALAKANEALTLDPANLLALNTRSSALIKLNQRDEAFSTIEGALHENPNDSYTHANYGWAQLEKGSPSKALEHFREALKNNPNNQMAQAGMQQALKARYLAYHWFLKYAFWMGNLTARYQWGVILGFYLLAKGLGRLADSNEALAPFIVPLIVLMSLVAFSTWIIGPISNLFLRLNPYGKHLLDKKERQSSNLVGICLALSLLSLLLYAFTSNLGWAFSGALFFTLMIPASSLFSPAKNGWLLVGGAILLLIMGVLATLIAFRYQLFFSKLSIYYLYALIGYQFLSNYLLIKEDNK